MVDDVYLKLHSLSKSLEGKGRIDEYDNPDAYGDILDAMKAVKELRTQLAEAQAKLQAFHTNTDHGCTMQDRHFDLGDDGVIYDENFDYDASIKVTGDFGDDKMKYAAMICAVLNNHEAMKAKLQEAEQKNKEIRKLLRKASGDMSYGHWSSDFRNQVERALK